MNIKQLLEDLRNLIKGECVEVNSINFTDTGWTVHVTSEWDKIKINENELNKVLSKYNFQCDHISYDTTYNYNGYDRDVDHAYIKLKEL